MNMKIAKSLYVILMVATMQTIYGRSHTPNDPEESPLRVGLATQTNTNPDLISHCASDVRCRCKASAIVGLVADCSSLNISVVPDFHSNVTAILLQRNNIRHLKIEGGQVSSSILYLDISENKLENFIGDPFRNMEALLYLDLSHNFLSYTSSVFPQNVFEGLKNLTYLNLKSNNRNKYQPADRLYPVSIGHITTLTTLRLDAMDPAGFTGDFKSLAHLESLDLEGHKGVCTLAILGSNYFQNVSAVQHLNLSYCNLTSIEVGTFRVLTQLYSLNISHNIRLTFSVMSNLTDDLQFVPIHTLDISKLHCAYGPGTSLYVEDFSKLSNHTHLTTMYLDSNRLSLFEPGVISILPKSIRFLSAKENRITFGKYIFELASASSLEVFDGSNQYTSHDPRTGHTDCNDWRAPPATRNNDRRAPPVTRDNDWRAPPATRDNGWRVSPVTRDDDLFSWEEAVFGMVQPPILTFDLPPNLKEVLFSNSVLVYAISERIPFAPNNVTRVDLHNNVLHSWEGTIANAQKVKHFDLSNNYCTFISDAVFNESPNLETLILHENLLGNVLYKDTNGSIFRQLIHLKVLDLSWNRIQTVPSLLLKNQKELKILNISENELTTFDLQLSHMTHLQYLNISNNQLHILSKYARQQIDKLKSGNLTVNLYGNKLQCSCETLDFLTWLDDNKAMLDNFRNYECRFSNDTYTTFSNFEDVLFELKKSCNSYTGLIAGMTSAIVLTISLTTSGIVYRYRWKLRYLYYMTKTRYRGYTGLEANNDERDDYLYDAFISYCEQDGRFVRGDLLENLEGRSGLRLCLHQRDFVPGQDIAENITNAIHQSRMTVVIVSNSYLKSYWCMYEFNMARMESIYARGGKSVLLLVFYEDVAPKDLPLTLMDLIESKSYIEYPQDDQGNIVFWEKLAETVSQ